MSPLFLSQDELATLTGRKLKSLQIDWLRNEGIPFRVNAVGHAVVTRGAVEGKKDSAVEQPAQRWMPRVVGVR